MDAITNFAFEEMLVRVIQREGGPWFVLADVCRVLDIRNSRDAGSRLDDDEKGVGITDTLGGRQEQIVINESGLYSLILTSRKPEAKKFKKWVTSEVLPAIRKTGSYGVPTIAEQEAIPFFDPNNAYAPLGARAAEAIYIGKKFGPAAELAARRAYGLGDFTEFARHASSAAAQECLAHLLNAVIDDGLSVIQHIKLAFETGEGLHPPLWRNGIRAVISDHPGIQVATNPLLLAAIFNGSQWAGGRHSKALRGLTGHEAGANQKFPDRMQSAVIFIPYGQLLG